MINHGQEGQTCSMQGLLTFSYLPQYTYCPVLNSHMCHVMGCTIGSRLIMNDVIAGQ